MGLFDKLISKLTGRTSTTSLPEPATTRIKPVPIGAGLSISVTISGPPGPTVPVSDAEVAEAASQYAFVLTHEVPLLNNADVWWDEVTHKRRVREGSEKAYAWLAPFVSVDLAKREQLKSTMGDWGPIQAEAIAKELRALVRERRKAVQPHQDLLLSLYGACVMADFVASLEFEGRQPHAMMQFVDGNELEGVRIDYVTMGYRCFKSLGKTDVKWLVEAFGEPADHQSFNSLWPQIRRNAISRYCWFALRTSNNSSQTLGMPQRTMEEWLNDLVKLNIGYYREWQERVAAKAARDAEFEATLESAWAATEQPFVVADLETTGLNAETDEVLEFGAVQATSLGEVVGEFSMLVRPASPIPEVITKLTGITPADVAREGRPLAEALNAFLVFAGSRPVFFHNAAFDAGFLKKAAARTGRTFSNHVHDTLPMARCAWPSLDSYKLAALAANAGGPAPNHRALVDARATLAVLLAARVKARPGLIS